MCRGPPAAGRSTGGGQCANRLEAHARKQGEETLLHPVGKGADNQQLGLRTAGQEGDKGGQGTVLPLGERGFDAAAGIIHHPHPPLHAGVDAFGSLGQVKLDHLRGAGTHQEEGADLGPPGQQIAHQPVEFLIGVRQACQVALSKDRGAETGFRKDHHPCSRLDQVGTGARAHHQKEGIGHAPVKPHDRGEAAEHLPLSAFAQHGWEAGRQGHGQEPVIHYGLATLAAENVSC